MEKINTKLVKIEVNSLLKCCLFSIIFCFYSYMLET